ncbi:MAG: STAS domain-containing protein [Thermodesulfobacteriota bacterium]|nr:STAS domain-containing protein [Thermodesulfobacteriota bacterium]
MAVIVKKRDGDVLVQLCGEFTIYEVNALHKALMDCLNDHDGLILDMRNVRKCDKAGVQLLASAMKRAGDARKHFAIENASVPVREAARRAGLGIVS